MLTFIISGNFYSPDTPNGVAESLNLWPQLVNEVFAEEAAELGSRIPCFP